MTMRLRCIKMRFGGRVKQLPGQKVNDMTVMLHDCHISRLWRGYAFLLAAYIRLHCGHWHLNHSVVNSAILVRAAFQMRDIARIIGFSEIILR